MKDRRLTFTNEPSIALVYSTAYASGNVYRNDRAPNARAAVEDYLNMMAALHEAEEYADVPSA